MDINPQLRQLIVHHHQAGHSSRQIAAMVQVSQSSVVRIIQRFRDTGAVDICRRSRCGRKRKLNKKSQRLLIRTSSKQPRLSALQLCESLPLVSQGVSTRTIQRELNRGGLLAFRPARCPSLSARQQRDRYEWALAHSDWTADDWAEVIFSDECAVDVSAETRPRFTRRFKQNPITASHTKSRRAFHQRVMIWSCISIHGPGPLVIIDGTMTGEKYVETLQQHLLPQITAWYGGVSHCGYQHDNAPCHTARDTKQFLMESGIQMVP